MVTPEAAARETKAGLVHDERGLVRGERARGALERHRAVRALLQLRREEAVSAARGQRQRLKPGQAIGAYHRENAQEGFLVLAGECVALVEGDEVRLEAWDYLHCPPRTAHAVVAAGDGPAVVLAVGRRGLPRKGIEYLPDDRVPPRQGSGSRTRVPYGDDWLPDL